MKFELSDFIKPMNENIIIPNSSIIIDCNTIIANIESYKDTGLYKWLHNNILDKNNSASILANKLLFNFFNRFIQYFYESDCELNISSGVISIRFFSNKNDKNTKMIVIVETLVEEFNNKFSI